MIKEFNKIIVFKTVYFSILDLFVFIGTNHQNYIIYKLVIRLLYCALLVCGCIFLY